MEAAGKKGEIEGLEGLSEHEKAKKLAEAELKNAPEID